MREVFSLSRLLLRRHRLMIGVWVVLLCAVTAAAVGQYQSAYRTRADFEANARLSEENVASTLLYGQLHFPGTPGLMFVWELGAFLTILAGVLGVLLSVALTRAEEEGGTLEVLRGMGVRATSPLVAALTVLSGVAVVLALGITVVTGVVGEGVDDVDWPGAVSLGVVVGLTFALFAALGVLCAQLAPTAGGASLLSFAILGLSFATRAYADVQQVEWLNWFSPLGLRGLVRPFERDRWWPLLIVLVVVMVLTVVASMLQRRREYGTGILRRRAESDSSLSVRSSFGLLARLSRASVLVWLVVVAAIGTLFAAMGSSVVTMSQDGAPNEGLLGTRLQTDPVTGYFAFSGILVALMTCVYAVLAVLRARRDETAGFTDQVWGTGISRWRPLGAQFGIAASGSLLILLVTGALCALIAPQVIDGDDVAARAFGFVVGQWPAVLAIAGGAVLCVGLLPRLTWLAWLPLATSGTFALLGDLLGIPQRVLDLGVFRHVPDVAASHRPVLALLVLVAIAALATSGGILSIIRRDVELG